MQVIIVKDYEEMSAAAAEIIGKVVRDKPDATLGLATGSTPLGCYELLANFCKNKRLSFKKVSAINLDEYVGLSANDKQSYAYFMRSNLFDKTDIDLNNAFIPCGTAEDMLEECSVYSRMLASRSRDVQLLGLGRNGHIGFNEPETPFDSQTRVVDLTETTIADNARLFGNVDEVPRQAVTMGISEIMSAKKILLLASGIAKAQAVYDMLCGEISTLCPASILRTHPDCTVIADKQAASLVGDCIRQMRT